MQGMNRNTGQPLSGTDHIRQSVADILTTPTGSRRMLMGYGSDIPLLVDNPVDKTTDIRLIMATAVALAQWEPRIRVDSVQVTRTGSGQVTLSLAATDVETERMLILENITL
jgi:phage baseplate assembly protein W